MRAVVVGPLAAFSVEDVARGWTSGLRSVGVDVAHVDIRPQLSYFIDAEFHGKRMERSEAKAAATLNVLGEIYQIDPDVVFVITGSDLDHSLLAQIKCPTVLVLTECPYELEGQALAAAAIEPQLILVNDPVGAPVFEQFAPTFYVPHAYQPDIHFGDPGDDRSGAVFVGSGFPNRIEWMERVDWSGIDLSLGGMWHVGDDSPLKRCKVGDDCIDNGETAAMYRRAAAGFNIYRTDSYGDHSTADGWAVGPREIELAACGVWFARQPRAEGDDLFWMLPRFESPEELGDLLRWALDHPTERADQARHAKAAIEDRTFAKNAERTLRRLGF